ncbi:MAG: MarR family transcriptional regulator [Cytophagales bacterium]|nr:MAG: MarR family transcriptional regulator [Cytophagales bacterium]
MKLELEIKQKSFKNEYAKCLVNLIFTSAWLEKKSKDFFIQYDLTPQQYNTLRILRGQHPVPSSINLIKERMLDKMSDASRIVQRLEVKKLLIKKIPSHNKRLMEVYINQAGLNILEEIDDKIIELEESLHRLNKNEIKTLNELLDKLRN